MWGLVAVTSHVSRALPGLPNWSRSLILKWSPGSKDLNNYCTAVPLLYRMWTAMEPTPHIITPKLNPGASGATIYIWNREHAVTSFLKISFWCLEGHSKPKVWTTLNEERWWSRYLLGLRWVIKATLSSSSLQPTSKKTLQKTVPPPQIPRATPLLTTSVP